MQGFIKVASTNELPPGEMKQVEIGDDRILLVNHDGTFYAWTDDCTHAGASLAEGDLDGDEVECYLHGSRFNITTGEVVDGPAAEPLGQYAVRVEGSDILIGPTEQG